MSQDIDNTAYRAGPASPHLCRLQSLLIVFFSLSTKQT